MNDDTEMLRRIALANAETANLNMRVAAMQAENMQRQVLGQSMAYVESDFHAEANLNYVTELLRP